MERFRTLRDLITETEAAEAALRAGDWLKAVEAYEALVRRKPKQVLFKHKLARAYFELKRLDDVIQLLSEESVKKIPKTKRILVATYLKLGNYAAALLLINDLLREFPKDAKLEERKKICEAKLSPDTLGGTSVGEAIGGAVARGGSIADYEEIVDRYSGSPLAWMKLGTALADAERNEDAARAYRQAVRLSPGDMNARTSLTRVMMRILGEREQITYVQEAIAAGNEDFECYRRLGRYHFDQQNWLTALQNFRSAVAIIPNHASTRLMVARVLIYLERYMEALEELKVVTALGTKPIKALQLKADVFLRLARVDEAIALYGEALRLDPKQALVSHRLSSALLLKGDIAGFHEHHEKRRQINSFVRNNKVYEFRDWNGEISIPGKLLVWFEAGLGVGQNVLHLTFLRLLAGLGIDVVVEAEPRLVDICRRSFPNMTIVASDGELPAGISHQTPIGSLSRWFKPDLRSFAHMRPYLSPDTNAVLAHRERFQRAIGRENMLVGISWTSSNPTAGQVKSIQLNELVRSIAVPGVTLVNLQYGDHSKSVRSAEAEIGTRILDSGVDNSNDLDGLAAVAAAMDLVVCIGHTTAHIAGAVGTSSFVILPSAPFPHWLAQGEQCIWYPSTRLFRRATTDEGWAEVLYAVRRALIDAVEIYDGGSRYDATLSSCWQSAAADLNPLSSEELRDAVSAFATQGAHRSAIELMERLPVEFHSRQIKFLRAELLADLGRWEDARTVYAALGCVNGGDFEVDSKLLALHLDAHKLADALPIARRLAVDDPAFRLKTANVHYRLRQHDEALSELRMLSLEVPHSEGLSTLFGTVLLEVGELERAEAFLAAEAPLTERSEDYTLLGRSLALQGRSQEALAAYDAAVSLAKANPAANFWRAQERIKAGSLTRISLPPIMGELPKVIPDDFVIFIAADNSYFWEHVLVLLNSLGNNSSCTKCHLHVINPDIRVASALDIVREAISPRVELSYSFEHIDLDACSDAFIRTYYASVRFVRLNEIFAKRPASYLCLDADCIVRGDIELHASKLGCFDVALRMRYDERPHMTVAAGALLLRPTVSAASFMVRVAASIEPSLEAREAVWFLDQVVLSNVVREMGGGEVSISQLDMTYIDWFFDSRSLVWTGKGKRKSSDVRYADELSKYRSIQKRLVRDSLGTD